MKDENYKTALKNAKHYLALGTKEVYLGKDGIDDKPWHLVTKCEPGGSHRLDISTGVWFYAKAPKSALEFRWTFDIEPYEANGKGSYEIDAAGCRKVLGLLTGAGRKAFQAYLRVCEVAVRKKAIEWEQVYLRQQRDADALGRLASTSPCGTEPK